MKTFSIFSQDGIGIFDAPSQNISARVERVTVGAVRTDFYKLVTNDGEYDFLVGVFDNKQDAEKNLKSLCKSLEKARQNKFQYDGWEPTQPTNGEITALELLDEIEHAARHKEKFFDVAKKILNADDDIPF